MMTNFKDSKSNSKTIMRPKKGFTLIELLVVISIIALLLSILMPSLSKVKKQAQGIVCRSNVRQLTLGWLLYAEDNDDGLVGGNTDSLPAPGDPSYGESWTYSWAFPPQEEDGTLNPPAGVDDPDAVTLENELRGIERGLLYRYVEDVELYRCKGARETIADGGHRSYSITGLMNGEDAKPARFPGEATTKTTKIVRPATKLVFLECTDNRGWNKGSWIMKNLDPYEWGDPIAVWHGKSSVMAFADGRAELHKWESNSTIYFAENYIGWTAPTFAPDFDGNYADLEFLNKVYLPKKQ